MLETEEMLGNKKSRINLPFLYQLRGALVSYIQLYLQLQVTKMCMLYYF
jgi:hypothetical protein